MLVMHGGGQIVIANDVFVTAVAIKGKGIRLAIEPKSILVDLQEVHDRRIPDWGDELSIMHEIDTCCPVG